MENLEALAKENDRLLLSSLGVDFYDCKDSSLLGGWWVWWLLWGG